MKAAGSEQDVFRALVRTIVAGDVPASLAILAASPALALDCAASGADRANAEASFFTAISHYVYAGDTALHMAAASGQVRIVADLIAKGADVRARNRRGAEPLHYACDGGPGSNGWNPVSQAAIVKLLIEAKADPNAVDKSGVAPLHRAVRNRCTAAVQTLIEGGADVTARNRAGSTPLSLASRTTGRSGSGSPEAKAEQQEILRLLKAFGAS